MALHKKLLQILLLWVIEAAIAASQAVRHGCLERCGNVSIPYPFGTSDGCYLNEDFLITCSHSFNPPKPFLWNGNIEVLHISLDGHLRILTFLWNGNIEALHISLDGHLRILTTVGSDCYNEQGNPQGGYYYSTNLPRFPFSTTRNKFTAVGCDTTAIFESFNGQHVRTGCMSVCDSSGSVTNGSCSGIGCCQTSIPKRLFNYSVSVSSFYNHTSVWNFNPCSYTFLVEEESFNFTSADLHNLQNRDKVPSVLDWAVGDQTCEETRKNSTSYACQADSHCYDSDNSPGYRCNCSAGYHGNPYLPSGCQDIDECADPSPCQKNCTNTAGSYYGSCPKGYHGDGTKDGEGCIADQFDHSLLIKFTLGIIISFIVILVVSSWLYWVLKQRKLSMLKDYFFRLNGGILLQEQISKYYGLVETAIIFTEEDLKKATNNYHASRVLGQGGQGTVYQGRLPNNRTIAIKKSKIGDGRLVEQFINELIVLSRVNHRNVVKLLGCCLETQVPLLVYEFANNGTLFDHIHNTSGAPSILWETRLRIAAETAGALSYLHSATSTPIIHRDVKTTNILLDEFYNVKVSDFGASRLVPLDKAQLTTLVQGTLGYLDPEYFHTSQLTEKSDVYSFGVVLVELLTGKKAFSFERPQEEINLAMWFISSVKENRLFELLDNRVLNKQNAMQIKEVAMLAKRCLRVKGEERPPMKEVAKELEGLRVMEKPSEISSEDEIMVNVDLPWISVQKKKKKKKVIRHWWW